VADQSHGRTTIVLSGRAANTLIAQIGCSN